MWKYGESGGWHFISLPLALSEEIRSYHKSEEEGWGRLKVQAQINQTKWDTAIWFDTKLNRYILPLKADIRKKEKLVLESELEVRLWI